VCSTCCLSGQTPIPLHLGPPARFPKIHPNMDSKEQDYATRDIAKEGPAVSAAEERPQEPIIDHTHVVKARRLDVS